MADQIEIKETLSRERFIQLLREFANSLENSSEFRLDIREKGIGIPTKGEMKVEIESTEQESEIEFKFKWKPAA